MVELGFKLITHMEGYTLTLLGIETWNARHLWRSTTGSVLIATWGILYGDKIGDDYGMVNLNHLVEGL